MGKVMRLDSFIIAALAISCVGCDLLPNGELEKRVALLEIKVGTLESQNAILAGKNNDLTDKVTSLEERLIAAAEVHTLPASTAPAEYIMWHSKQYTGSYLVGYVKPKPVFAYNSKAECEAAVIANIKSFEGDTGTWTYKSPANGGFDVNTLSCLPKGVDPR